MIKFDNVSKSFPNGHQALTNLNLHLPKGEMAFLTGHSGAGKSTLLKLLALIERPTRGQLFVNGRNLNSIHKNLIPYYRQHLGLVFQDNQLLQDRSVFDNVALPLVIKGMGKKDITRRTEAALDQVELLNKARSLPLDLSSGEQQRVGIARAIVSKPMLLLADEPTGNLDPELSWDILQLFKRFNEVGVTVLIASHDLSLIDQMDQPVITLSHSRLTSTS
ncbi:MAG: cell division ATP-binding protein FtsE [Gammaproteobacteria bacterium]|nr:cell division ATP-binding protein FtsE [Gammaproteobacteria bacterium]NNC98446.1 cell division ATP-binding protein FtsE [Gammaproteobacteria bacterium]NNM14753.1 cell division ATP-binding protein FtsE [Gammaproteobacteria bacterium]